MFYYVFKLLSIFVSGRLSDYSTFYEKNKEFVDSSGKFNVNLFLLKKTSSIEFYKLWPFSLFKATVYLGTETVSCCLLLYGWH